MNILIERTQLFKIIIMSSAYKYHFYSSIKLKDILVKLFDISILKGFLIASFAVVANFFAPIYPFILGAFALSLIDYIVGKKAAEKSKEKITSKKMRRSIDKCLVYMLFIIAAHIVEVTFIAPFLNAEPLAYFAALAVARVEFFSIDENINKMTGVSVAQHVKHLFDFSSKVEK